MVYVFGSRLYGKCDVIPGVGHVATKFGHFDYIPLIPTESWLVFETTSNGWRGIRIPFSAKSMLLGWGRAAAIILLAICTILTITQFGEWQRTRNIGPRVTRSGRVIANGPGAETWLFPLIGVCASLFVIIGTRYIPGIGKASPHRMAQLLQMAGINDDVIDDLRRANYNLPPTSGFEVMPARQMDSSQTG